jgi:hypothetical protein
MQIGNDDRHNRGCGERGPRRSEETKRVARIGRNRVLRSTPAELQIRIEEVGFERARGEKSGRVFAAAQTNTIEKTK